MQNKCHVRIFATYAAIACLCVTGILAVHFTLG